MMETGCELDLKMLTVFLLNIVASLKNSAFATLLSSCGLLLVEISKYSNYCFIFYLKSRVNLNL